MSDAIISAVAQQLVDTTAKLIRDEVNLVRGLEKELENLSHELNMTRSILHDAEKRRYKDTSIRMWLKRLEATCYEMEDVLDEWDYYLLSQKVITTSFMPSSSSSCFCFTKISNHHHISIKVKEAKEKLERVLKEKERYDLVVSEPSDHVDGLGRDPSTSFVDLGNIFGRDNDKETLLSKILGNEGTTSKEQMDMIQIISVVGLGGIGKTTLAQFLFNDSRVERFYRLKIWICVSDPFDQFGIVKGIIQKVTGKCPDTDQLDLLLEHLKDVITGKKFLLVLDDVWTEERNKWEPLKDCLKFGGKGSKILVTTRNERVAKMMGTMKCDIHHVGVLSDEHCWLILSRIALFDKSEIEKEKFKEVGKEIANKCKGLPLAAKVLGSILCLKTSLSEWEDIAKSQMWELKEANVDLFPHLILSYNELSPLLKRCFSYCGIFPEDFEIDVEFLINNWSALGYLGSITNGQIRGRDYLNNLVMRSLLNGFKWEYTAKRAITKCKMHDIVRDFARFIRNEASDYMVKAFCQSCSSTMISNVEEYRSLHCFDGSPTVICDCLKHLRVFSLGRMERQLFSISETRYVPFPRGIEKLIHLRELNITSIWELGEEDLKPICKLYHLKILTLRACNLRKIPKEIGNLTRLEYLDLSKNYKLRGIPESIRALHELQYFNISHCQCLSTLPKGIQNLTKLEILCNENTFCKEYFQFPDEAASHLIGLRKLDEFWGKLNDLKKLNQLCGQLTLFIRDDVRDATEAEMNKKGCLQRLQMNFPRMNEAESADWMGVLDALEPHRNLNFLGIWSYRGTQFPNWISSAHNRVKTIELKHLPKVASLPPLGNLPFLECLTIEGANAMEALGREFLGITRGSSGNVESCSTSMASTSAAVVAFPMLKELKFSKCYMWNVWEDLTIEEESSAALTLFPSLESFTCISCGNLRELPHRLLRRTYRLRNLTIRESLMLQQRYDKNDEDSAWNSISHIPHVSFTY